MGSNFKQDSHAYNYQYYFQEKFNLNIKNNIRHTHMVTCTI